MTSPHAVVRFYSKEEEEDDGVPDVSQETVIKFFDLINFEQSSAVVRFPAGVFSVNSMVEAPVLLRIMHCTRVKPVAYLVVPRLFGKPWYSVT